MRPPPRLRIEEHAIIRAILDARAEGTATRPRRRPGYEDCSR
jgi:hypothetical protein